MGGEIRLDSVEGRGTTCWFSVVFNKATSDTSAGESQPEARPALIIPYHLDGCSDASYGRIRSDKIDQNRQI